MSDLETENLRLESLRADHATVMWDVTQNPALYTYIPRDPPMSFEALTKRYTAIEKGVSPDGTEIWLNWVIFLKNPDKTCIGKLESTITAAKTAYIAYEVASDFQGKGYATESCLAMLAAIRRDNAPKIFCAHVDTRNEKSIRLLERLGFQRTRTIENADHFKGASSDEYVYELNPADLSSSS